MKTCPVGGGFFLASAAAGASSVATASPISARLITPATAETVFLAAAERLEGGDRVAVEQCAVGERAWRAGDPRPDPALEILADPRRDALRAPIGLEALEP